MDTPFFDALGDLEQIFFLRLWLTLIKEPNKVSLTICDIDNGSIMNRGTRPEKKKGKQKE